MIEFDYSKKVDGKKYYQVMSDKHQIVIGHSYSDSIDYVDNWEKRNGGRYKMTVPFSIDLDGVIYQHYDPKYSSEFIGSEIDDNIIPINLVNEGWLLKDEENTYFNTFGSIYNREAKPIVMDWRGKKYWAPYTKEQMDSLHKLCVFLSREFNIPLNPMGHNTRVGTIDGLKGIAYKSNYSELYRDVSPAFDFDYFLKNFEQYEIN